jgi:hypothetical protein
MLTQLATVKTRLRLNSFDVDDDALITGLIRHASGRFALECNRTFDRGVDVTFEFRADQIDILPERYPVESVASFDLKSNETDGWIAQPNIVYLFSPERCVVELATTLGNSRQKGRITYTGGYVLPGATPDAGQTALPDELEQACIDQVVYWHQNRNRLGILSTAGEGGSIQNMKTLDLLPHVAAVLRKYERFVN